MIIIGDEDELSKDICIEYRGLTEADGEVLENYGTYYQEDFIKQVRSKNGVYLWSGENWYAPIEWGTTKVEVVIQEVDV